MKVLYVLGNGSKRGNMELRWSLRSVEKHAKNAEIIVVGEPPEWLNPETVKAVRYEDRFGSKHENILDHILHAADDGLVEGEFLYSSDDHFFVKDVDFDDYPIWIRNGKLQKEADYNGRPIAKYQRSIIDTRTILEEFGYTYLVFHGHYNTHMNTAEIPAIRKMLEAEPRGRYGYEPTEMFMNTRTARESLDCVTRGDLKLGTFNGPAAMEKYIGSNDSFSISDGAFRKEIGANPDGSKVFVDSGLEEYMNSLYPDKSRYEK